MKMNEHLTAPLAEIEPLVIALGNCLGASGADAPRKLMAVSALAVVSAECAREMIPEDLHEPLRHLRDARSGLGWRPCAWRRWMVKGSDAKGVRRERLGRGGDDGAVGAVGVGGVQMRTLIGGAGFSFDDISEVRNGYGN